MKCLKCSNDQFIEQEAQFSPEIKGEIIEFIVPCKVCSNCKSPLIDTAKMNHLRRVAADKYREKHELLTSRQIIAYRESLGMSQVAFARYLSIGEASIKRWETYFIQDASQDDHIRLKCDESYAESNALNVNWKSHPPDIYSGNLRFSWEIFKQTVRYLIQYAKSPLFLNKALFYADFKHFQLHGVSITGARYSHWEYGPCPDHFQNLIYFLVHEGELIPAGHHVLKSMKKSDLSVFGKTEKEVLELIAKFVKIDGGQKLLDLSHEEEAYKKTEPTQLISYEFAKTLKI